MKKDCTRPVFILEDDLKEIEHIKRTIICNLHMPLIAMHNSDTAMHWISNSYQPCAAYILDIEMTGQKYSGIDFAEQIRQQPDAKLTPIIFLASHSHYGMGALQHIHYYDFLNKPCNFEDLLRSLQSAFQIEHTSPLTESLILDCKKGVYELDPNDIYCIEQFGTEIMITDFLGQEAIYKVKRHAFTNLCEQLHRTENHHLQQVIINLNRIRKIDRQKNYATVWLFNVNRGKPIGKTYIHHLSIYKE